MKQIYLPLACFVLLVGCVKTKRVNNCRPEQLDFVFNENKGIDTTHFSIDSTHPPYFTITNGSHLLFTYTHTNEDCPEIADEEGFQKILFELPVDSTKFNWQDSTAFRAAKAIIAVGCGECAIERTAYFVTTGFIKGEKISSTTWQVEAAVQLPWNPATTLRFNHDFEKQ